MKFGFPFAHTAALLAWSMVEYEEGYRAAGELDQGTMGGGKSTLACVTVCPVAPGMSSLSLQGSRMDALLLSCFPHGH